MTRYAEKLYELDVHEVLYTFIGDLLIAETNQESCLYSLYLLIIYLHIIISYSGCHAGHGPINISYLLFHMFFTLNILFSIAFAIHVHVLIKVGYI